MKSFFNKHTLKKQNITKNHKARFVIFLLAWVVVVFLILYLEMHSAVYVVIAVLSSLTTLTISNHDRIHELSILAYERRLEKHQEAFKIWLQLMKNAKNEHKIYEIISKAQDWWAGNCLYLDVNARKKFKTAIVSASLHCSACSSKDNETMKETWHDIIKAGEALTTAVGLPSLDCDEIDNNT